MSDPQSHEEFTRVWRAEAPHVLAFATRHVGPGMAHDVVAETFTIAWRRWGEVPVPPIAWLLVTARKVIMNRARAQRRHRALAARVATPSSASPVSTRSTAKRCSWSPGTD